MFDLESLFNLSYPMCIVCSKKQGKINGCIINTVFQIVPEPQIIAFSINKESLTYEYITDSKVLTISVLAEGAPIKLIGNFGFRTGRNVDKFELVEYKLGQNGVPIIIDNVTSYIEAEVLDIRNIETHMLCLCKITACQTIDDGLIPMTYTYYRDVKGGRTPRSAATYINKKKQEKEKESKMKKYKCLLCGYIYDPETGDPDNGVEAGTMFENLPDDWVCPECGAGKDEFEPVES